VALVVAGRLPIVVAGTCFGIIYVAGPKNVCALFPYLFIFLCFRVCLLLLLVLFGSIKSCRENVLFTEKCICMSARDICIIVKQMPARLRVYGELSLLFWATPKLENTRKC